MCVDKNEQTTVSTDFFLGMKSNTVGRKSYFIHSSWKRHLIIKRSCPFSHSRFRLLTSSYVVFQHPHFADGSWHTFTKSQRSTWTAVDRIEPVTFIRKAHVSDRLATFYLPGFHAVHLQIHAFGIQTLRPVSFGEGLLIEERSLQNSCSLNVSTTLEMKTFKNFATFLFDLNVHFYAKTRVSISFLNRT